MTDQKEFDAKICEMGAAFSPHIMMQTREMFREPIEATDWGTTESDDDLAYGEHERQKLDVYRTSKANAPVVLFVHGGGFVAGDKASDPTFYGNVPRYFANNGYTGVAMNYRLAPDVTWPAGSEDVAAALAWVVENIADYGGNPENIIILGQSAGAAHSASVIFDDRFRLPAAVKGAALLSGFYKASPPMEGGPALYFGPEDEWADRSPVTHVAANHIPIMLGVASFDPAIIAEQTFYLAQALNKANGQPPRIHWWENHNHVSPVHSLGLGTDIVGKILCGYFESILA